MKGLTKEVEEARAQIIQELKKSENWKPNIKAVAEAVGLSSKSVSKYLRTIEDRVSFDMRIEVKAPWPKK